VRGLRAGAGEHAALLEEIGLGPREHRRPVGTFSSGMKQRVKLALAVLHDPAVLLLDEPSSNLDEAGHRVVAALVERFRARAAVAVASNDPREIAWAMRASSLLSEALAVLGKEWTSELRSRVALNAIGLFALTTLIAVAYQIGPYRISEADRPFLLAALLWIILFFAASSGLARVFVKEEDAHTAKTLRLAARPAAVFAGKLLFNLILLLCLEALIVPLFCALMGFAVRSVAGLALVSRSGGGLASTATIVAAIIARASGSGTLFAILTVPLALPLLVFLIQGTRAAAQADAIAAVFPALRAIVSLAGVTLVASVYLFPVVWHD